MKRTEMLQTLKLQYKNTNKEIDKLQLEIQKKKDILIKLEGALEALEALEPDEPAPAGLSVADPWLGMSRHI